MSCHPGSDCYSCGWVDKEHHFPVSLILRGNWETGELNQTELHCSTLCHAGEIATFTSINILQSYNGELSLYKLFLSNATSHFSDLCRKHL